MSSISLEGGRSKDIVRLCHLSSHFKNFSHQKLFFDLKDKNYKKAKMKGGLGWMIIIWNDPRSLFNGNHFSSNNIYLFYTSYSYNSISRYAYRGISAHIPRRDLVIFCVLRSH